MFCLHNRKQKNKQSAFTLIELLVVIAIISLLSSIVLSNLNEARGKARDARRKSDLIQMRLALEYYFDTHDKFPDNTWNYDGSETSRGFSNDHVACGTDPDWDNTSGITSLVGENYISSLAKDPLNNGNYCYRYIPTDDKLKGACMWALLENGKKVGIVAGNPDPGINGNPFPAGFRCNFLDQVLLGDISSPPPAACASGGTGSGCVASP
jgi:prepilin-type N-terminal cleavage/methylation domain-containing protein